MLVLVTYDVSTETSEGKKRLRKVSRECLKYGQRVQNSVFECVLDAALSRKLQSNLEKLINKDTDSLRFYFLGNNYKEKVIHIGVKPSYDVTEPMIF